MAQLVVRELEPQIKERLKRRARRNGHSMEAEVRDILRHAVADSIQPAINLGSRISARFRGRGLTADLPELRGQAPRAADLGK